MSRDFMLEDALAKLRELGAVEDYRSSFPEVARDWTSPYLRLGGAISWAHRRLPEAEQTVFWSCAFEIIDNLPGERRFPVLWAIRGDTYRDQPRHLHMLLMNKMLGALDHLPADLRCINAKRMCEWTDQTDIRDAALEKALSYAKSSDNPVSELGALVAFSEPRLRHNPALYIYILEEWGTSLEKLPATERPKKLSDYWDFVAYYAPKGSALKSKAAAQLNTPAPRTPGAGPD